MFISKLLLLLELEYESRLTSRGAVNIVSPKYVSDRIAKQRKYACDIAYRSGALSHLFGEG